MSNISLAGIKENVSLKEKIASLVWQHLLLLASLFLMTLGVALCVRSNLGSSVISSAPLAFTLGGEAGIVPPLTLGEYTNLLNVLLVAGQIVVLRRRYEAVQLLQLAIGFVFGALIDFNMWLTSSLSCTTLLSQGAIQLAGCTVLALGVSFEVRCGSVTMPGEGLPVAISRLTGRPFAQVKIFVDIALVVLAVASCYLFFGRWQWNVVGGGTLFAMVYVGMAVKFISRHTQWFDRLLCYRPGFRRYVYGLARYLLSKKER